jgi:hypothetical protein
MTEDPNNQELKERLELIEKMLLAGRRKTERWGWTFLLWGIAYYAAIVISHLTHARWAWPATMISAGIITYLLSLRFRQTRTGTTMGRVICAIWISLGASMFLLFMSMAMNHMLYERVFVAVVCTLLGMANAISGITLKWKMQIACAIVWWVTAVVACFGNEFQSWVVFLVAIFFCQIVFGVYAMICDSKNRKSGDAHA